MQQLHLWFIRFLVLYLFCGHIESAFEFYRGGLRFNFASKLAIVVDCRCNNELSCGAGKMQFRVIFITKDNFKLEGNVSLMRV